ncbi:ricin-type beta-trefoil lectin domain protein [Lentzea indica]|nr:ricin-type beta-trefoil lectin domain protein [Lentzea indica]
MTGRSLGVAAAIAAAVTLGAMTTVPASAEPAGNTIIELKNVARGQCMTAGKNDYFQVEMADCTGAANQRWEKVGLPNGQFFLRNIADRWCVDGEHSLITDSCDETDKYQRWELAQDASGATKLKLAVSWPAYADTSLYDMLDLKIIPNEPQDSDHQRWVVTEIGGVPPLPDTTGALVTLENSRWWSVDLTDTCVSGAGMGACPGSVFQRVELGGGAFQLRAADVCLRPKPGSRLDADLLGDCATADPSQQWRLEGPDLFGGHLIRNVGKGTYLTPGSPSVQLFEKDPFGKDPQLQRWYLHLA